MITLVVAFLALSGLFVLSAWRPAAVFWGILILAPFQAALNPVVGVDLPVVRVLVPVLLMGWLVHRWRDGISTKLSAASLGFVFLAGWGTASALWAADAGAALQRSTVWWSLIPLLVTAEDVLRDRRRRLHILPTVVSWIVIAVGTVALAAAVAAWIGFHDEALEIIRAAAPRLWGQDFASTVLSYPSWFVDVSGYRVLRAFFPFPDPHMLAFFFALTLPIVAVSEWRPRTLLSLLVGGAAFLATFSRGGYLGLFAATMAVMVLSGRWGLPRRRTSIIVVVSILLLLVTPIVGNRLRSLQDADLSFQSRRANMRQAWGVIVRHPFMGVGFGNYAIVVDPSASSGTPIYAHSSYLDVAAELGLPAVAVAAALVGLLVARAARSPTDRYAAAAVAAAVWFGVHAAVDTPIFSPRVLPFFFVIVALLSYGTQEQRTQRYE